MSQIGKLYKFYFRKIWQKNWLRIIIFTVLIGVVWWFVVPWGITKAWKGMVLSRGKNATEEEKEKFKELNRFSEMCRRGFGDDGFDQWKKKNREETEEMLKEMEAGKEVDWQERMAKLGLDSSSFMGINTPFTADNNFFFSQTEGYTEGKAFWKMLFDISWWNLAGVAVLYWFIFEVFDKTFFSSRKDGEDITVLTYAPGVKRSDLIWGKIFAFLSFYFLINIVLFLIPFSVYYWWLASNSQFSWFALLALITMVVGLILFFGLIFAPHLFFSSLLGGSKWIFSTLICFFPLLWSGLKVFVSSAWPWTIEKFFFDPVWFSIIALVCGIFFLTLYYLRYQEEDFN